MGYFARVHNIIYAERENCVTGRIELGHHTLFAIEEGICFLVVLLLLVFRIETFVVAIYLFNLISKESRVKRSTQL